MTPLEPLVFCASLYVILMIGLPYAALILAFVLRGEGVKMNWLNGVMLTLACAGMWWVFS